MVAEGKYEQALWDQGYKYVACVDEVGCGSLAGDVYVGAVVFPVNFDFNIIRGMDDSKKKTEVQRNNLYELIKKHALTYAVCTASVDEIDVYNIYWAKFMAAERAIKALDVKPDFVYMDGNAVIPGLNIEQKAIIKGDSKVFSIAAASILAKVERDRYIVELSKQVHSDYDWANNKAYYNQNHIKALKKYGKTKWHRSKYVEKFL